MIENMTQPTEAPQGVTGSTLIEFPGVNRNRPAWRKELSERFREIQQRRAREAALEAEAAISGGPERSESTATEEFEATPVNASKAAETNKQLGLVPPPPVAPEMNPIVVAALRRLERARSQSGTAPQHVGRGGSRAAAAVARVVEEQLEPLPQTERPAPQQPEPTPAPRSESLRAASPAKSGTTAEKAPEEAKEAEPAPRTSALIVVQAQAQAEATLAAEVSEAAKVKAEAPAAPAPSTTLKASDASKAEAAVKEEQKEAAPAPAAPAQEAEAKPQTRHLAGVIDDHWLERREAELLPKVASVPATYDDRAPRFKRFVAAVIDLLVIAFLSAPFAAVIELTIGNWGDPRVMGSMGGILLLVMFLYHTCSIALAGRTWGMSIMSLHAVDARTASVPKTGQCVRRALFYIFSLATLGLGILYSLFDAEGRTAHDLLSGTVVIKE